MSSSKGLTAALVVALICSSGMPGLLSAKDDATVTGQQLLKEGGELVAEMASFAILMSLLRSAADMAHNRYTNNTPQCTVRKQVHESTWKAYTGTAHKAITTVVFAKHMSDYCKLLRTYFMQKGKCAWSSTIKPMIL